MASDTLVGTARRLSDKWGFSRYHSSGSPVIFVHNMTEFTDHIRSTKASYQELKDWVESGFSEPIVVIPEKSVWILSPGPVCRREDV